MDEREVAWSALPVELLPLIGKSIQDRVDALRFRSVCASWRSSIPPPCDILPPYPLPPPCPTISDREAYVSYGTIYRLKLPDDVNPNPSTCSSKSWLVKVEEFEFGRKCLLNPLPNLRSGFPFPKGINLLDYQVVEVSKEYKLQSIFGMPIVGVNKLVLFPDSAWNSCVEDTVIFALYDEGKLGYVKYGDKNWTHLVDDFDFIHYDDIIVYKGKPCVVDDDGKVSWIDSSMKLIEFACSFYYWADQKHLVESCGELYLVGRCFDVESRFHPDLYFAIEATVDHDLREYRRGRKTITFKVYKLDQERHRWVKVKNLGDQVFILGKDSSFSVSATEFPGCKGNCIYFTYEGDSGVFDQKTGEIVDFQDPCPLFQPPPSWLS